MKAIVLSLIGLLALGACDGGAPDTEQTTTPETAGAETPTPAETLAPGALPPASTIPAAIRGRWGLTLADCEPGRDDAKGLLTITADKLDFYESVGTLDDVKELGESRIRAEFDFVGEGQEWQRDMTLEAREGGTVLIRREDGVDAAPGDFRYTKCA